MPSWLVGFKHCLKQESSKLTNAILKATQTPEHASLPYLPLSPFPGVNDLRFLYGGEVSLWT